MSPRDIFDKMYEKDALSQAMKMRLQHIGLGFCTLQMEVHKDMLNGFGVAHGGITYCLSDSAFAFASNSRGHHAVSIETSIAHLAAVFQGDVLTAIAREKHLTYKTGHYTVDVLNQNAVLVASFTGTVYRKSAQWTNVKEDLK